MNIIKKITTQLKINSARQFFLVMTVFAVTGSLSLILSDKILFLIGFNAELLTNLFYWPIKIILIFLIYQILLLLVAFLFGQFDYFWLFEKKMLKRFGIKFKSKSE